MYNITFEEVRYFLILYPGKVEVFMHRYSKAVLYSLLLIAAFFVTAQNSWAQNEITFAGVTHLRTPSNESYTNLGLGINFDPGNVLSACVLYPDNTTEYCYSADQFYNELGDTFYFISLPGPPQLGI